MKLRSHVLALLALLSFSLPAAAQARPAAAQARAAAPARSTSSAPVRYGSYERTKLLTQGQKRVSADVMRLGAADRRALLTTGKSIHKKKPERRYGR